MNHTVYCPRLLSPARTEAELKAAIEAKSDLLTLHIDLTALFAKTGGIGRLIDKYCTDKASCSTDISYLISALEYDPHLAGVLSYLCSQVDPCSTDMWSVPSLPRRLLRELFPTVKSNRIESWVDAGYIYEDMYGALEFLIPHHAKGFIEYFTADITRLERYVFRGVMSGWGSKGLAGTVLESYVIKRYLRECEPPFDDERFQYNGRRLALSVQGNGDTERLNPDIPLPSTAQGGLASLYSEILLISSQQGLSFIVFLPPTIEAGLVRVRIGLIKCGNYTDTRILKHNGNDRSPHTSSYIIKRANTAWLTLSTHLTEQYGADSYMLDSFALITSHVVDDEIHDMSSGSVLIGESNVPFILSSQKEFEVVFKTELKNMGLI